MSFQETSQPTEAPVEPPAAQETSQAPPPPMDLTKYKTKLCRNYMQKGNCNFGNTCMFAHGKHDLQGSPGMQQHHHQTKFEMGHADPTKYKTKLCRHFLNTGTCPFMDRCGFAHGQMELNGPAGVVPPMAGPMAGYHAQAYDGYYGMPGMPEMAHPPQMKRPPVMELAKTRLCKHFSATGSCPYESRCLFAHGQQELRSREAMMPMQHPHHPMMQHSRAVPVPMPSGVPGPVPHGVQQSSHAQWASWTQQQQFPFMPS